MTTTPTPTPELLPEVIYLQAHGDSDEADRTMCPWPGDDVVTWCRDRIWDSDVEYRRAPAPVAAGEWFAVEDNTGAMLFRDESAARSFAAMAGRRLFQVAELPPLPPASEPAPDVSSLTATVTENEVSLEHSMSADFNRVKADMIRLRDHLNDRLEKQSQCPFHPPAPDVAPDARKVAAEAWVVCCLEGIDPIYCETLEEIYAAVAEALFGGIPDSEDHERELQKSVEVLLRDTILRFEGDPPLHLLKVKRLRHLPAPDATLEPNETL
jgi:hypothetical protein